MVNEICSYQNRKARTVYLLQPEMGWMLNLVGRKLPSLTAQVDSAGLTTKGLPQPHEHTQSSLIQKFWSSHYFLASISNAAISERASTEKVTSQRPAFKWNFEFISLSINISQIVLLRYFHKTVGLWVCQFMSINIVIIHNYLTWQNI